MDAEQSHLRTICHASDTQLNAGLSVGISEGRHAIGET